MGVVIILALAVLTANDLQYSTEALLFNLH